MTSHPPAACCARGFKHEGTATGETKKIDNYDAYVAKPDNPDPEHAVLILCDIMGIHSNAQFLADDFAAAGYLTILPDLFHGKALTVDQVEKGIVDIPSFLQNHGIETVEPVIDATIKYLREETGVKKIAAAGYCFGGKYVCRYLAGRGVDVGYNAHPSFVTSDELAAISGPLSIAAAESDSIFPPDLRHKSEEILAGTKLPYQINLFSGVEHGFAIRGDLSVPWNKFTKEQALQQAVTWFKYHL